ncbi:MAG: hypothetical protein AB7T49_15990 [Oligoflexales bacterium]
MKGNGITSIILAAAFAMGVGTVSCTKEKRIVKTIPADPKKVDDNVDDNKNNDAVRISIRDKDGLATQIKDGVLIVKFDIAGATASDFDLYCAVSEDIAGGQARPCSAADSHEVRDLLPGKLYYVKVVAVNRTTGVEITSATTTFLCPGSEARIGFKNRDDLRGVSSGPFALELDNPNGLDIRCNLQEVTCGRDAIQFDLDDAFLRSKVLTVSALDLGGKVVWTEDVELCGGACEVVALYEDATGWLSMSRAFRVLIPDSMYLLTYANDEGAFSHGKITRYEIMDDEATPPSQNCGVNLFNPGRIVAVDNPDTSRHAYCKSFINGPKYKDQSGFASYNAIEFSSDARELRASGNGKYERFEFQAMDEEAQVVAQPAYKELCKFSYTHGTETVDALNKYWNEGGLLYGGSRPVNLKICLTTITVDLKLVDVWVIGFSYQKNNGNIPAVLEMTYVATVQSVGSAVDAGRAIGRAARRIREITVETTLNEPQWADYIP